MIAAACAIMLTVMTRDGGDYEAHRLPFNRSSIARVVEHNTRDGSARAKIYMKSRGGPVLVFETPLQIAEAPCR